ncbi:MAG: hypothetical protein HY744_25170 [Deltaproteobacteria bacterium]|nr:hypothetical protein [Deltaproteobacteria bacterium]
MPIADSPIRRTRSGGSACAIAALLTCTSCSATNPEHDLAGTSQAGVQMNRYGTYYEVSIDAYRACP